jgi:type II secretory pathway pseudopilin PulG
MSGTGQLSTGNRRGRESGYALLLVLLVAAIIAISLYSEVPRIAFQSQRHKEQLLMERGMQYMRAIQVYQQVNKNQWPRNLDDIENFQNRHFLRHHYIDPMTGKDEWRLIHVQGNVLTDSLVTQNPATQQKSASSESTYISDYGGVGQSPIADQTQRPQDRRRASEGGEGAGELPGMPGMPDQPGNAPGDAGAAGSSGNPANPASSTNPSASGSPPGTPGTPGAPGAPGTPGSPGTTLPGQTQYPSIGYNPAYPNGVPPSPQDPSAQPTPGMPGAGGNPALAMINRLLTGPSPQTSATPSAFSSSTTLGGGLAGVASKSGDEGIMEYNSQTLYKKWEFVFDPTKVASMGAPTSGTPGLSPSQMGSQNPAAGGLSSAFGGQSSTSPSGSMNSAFGSSMGQTGGGGGLAGGMGASSGFGSSSSGFGSSAFGSSAFGSSTTGTGAPGGTGTGAPGSQAAATSTALPPGYRPGRP